MRSSATGSAPATGACCAMVTCYLEGRIKEMIIRGGENISPAEIEEVLLAHPAVRDAVCFGVPDDKYGELVGAAVTLRADAEPRRSDRALPRAARRLQGARAGSTCWRRFRARRQARSSGAGSESSSPSAGLAHEVRGARRRRDRRLCRSRPRPRRGRRHADRQGRPPAGDGRATVSGSSRRAATSPPAPR